jgi:pimeloyl-ACP methyl ester carboxylesterase
METRLATPDGLELFVRTIGSGAPLIMPLACWSEEFDVLADSSQLVLYDPRGRGQSSPIDAACVGFERDIADLELVREHLDLDMVALIGWSYFGGVVARYAMRHPDRIARMVLIGSTPVRAGSFFRAVQEEQAARFQREAPNLMREMSSGAPTREQLQAWSDAFHRTRSAVKPPWPNRRSRPSQYANEQVERAMPLIGAALRSMGDWDWREDARAIDAPVLVVAGEADILPYEACREWLAALPNVRAVVMPGVGHLPSIEAPDRFFPLLREFLMGDWPAACLTSL